MLEPVPPRDPSLACRILRPLLPLGPSSPGPPDPLRRERGLVQPPRPRLRPLRGLRRGRRGARGGEADQEGIAVGLVWVDDLVAGVVAWKEKRKQRCLNEI